MSRVRTLFTALISRRPNYSRLSLGLFNWRLQTQFSDASTRRSDSILRSAPEGNSLSVATNMTDKADGTDAPAAAEVFSYDGQEYAVIKEGLASILIPPQAKANKEEQQVFYNSIQQFNRDLTVVAITAYWEERGSRGKPRAKNKRNKKRKRLEGRVQVDSNNKAPKTSPDSAPHSTSEVKGDGKPDGDEKNETTGPEESAMDDEIEAGNTDEVPGEEETTNERGALEESAAPAKTGHSPSAPPFTILDALSASGLRALRYGHELPFATSITANDLSASAVKSIELNVKHNKLEDKITVSHNDAMAHLYGRLAQDLSKRDKFGGPTSANKYNVIDLDPYGTAAPFLDAAVQSVKDGGLLCVTCTDSAVWAGHGYCEKAYVLYGGIPVRGFWSHEAGLRLVLNAIAMSAARYSLTIEPLLSLSIDYYVRIFVRVAKSQANLKFSASKSMIVYNCGQGCQTWELQPLMKTRQVLSKNSGTMQYKHGMAQGPVCDVFCPHCRTKMHLAGPMYAGPLHSPSFIRRMQEMVPTLDPAVYGTIPRLTGMLQTALEEFMPTPWSEGQDDGQGPREPSLADVDPFPFYFSISHLASVFQTMTPPEDTFRGALRHLGYHVTRSHCKPGSIKTDAPWSTIMWAMREWIRQKAPVKKHKIKPFTPTWRIHHLDNDPELSGKAEANENAGVEPKEGQTAPKEGPTGGSPTSEEELEKRKTLLFNSELDRLGRDESARGIVRYQLNPRENWGPMTKAKG